jgi:hypothetical protein
VFCSNNGLILLPRDKFASWMTEYPAAKAAYDKAPRESRAKLAQWWELKQWTTDNILPVAFALAKDQAVAAGTDSAMKIHKLSGYLRADGKKSWTVDLPEQPATYSLAVDRDGRVLVSLCDGSVVCVGK